MTARVPERRTKTGRELAEEFGVSRSTVVRTIAEPRSEYEQRAEQRRETAVRLRRQGLTYREIADQTGTSLGAVGRLLHDARRHRERAAAAERRAADHGA
ncbi:sigma factor-like helix-turn-helix DNA-binding protein [Pseudonocardia sp. Ae263_Ps1]|uniref:sigma factor-like helix-turn-helix DNA-binding protein n=1 Tax=Pseudonocardia sp. Ae263_Ps1 TaxID=1885030 RepID=UPI00094B7106